MQEKDKLDEAISCYQKALQINPNFADAYSELTYQMQRRCNWQELGAMTAKCDDLTRKALDAGIKPAETPFISIVDTLTHLLISLLQSHGVAILQGLCLT